jgi:site-specific DNA-methyltransferase (adenine-specific)
MYPPALHVGDCLDILPTIPDASIDLVLCDLPYGTTRCEFDVCVPLEKLWPHYERVTKSNAPIVLFAQTPFDKALGASRLDLLRYEYVWEKNIATGHLNARRAPLKAHENILVFCKGRPPYYPQMSAGKPYTSHHKAGRESANYGNIHEHTTTNTGTRFPRSVLRFDTVRNGELRHPHQKPVPLLTWLILTYTQPGAVVLDSAMGSGSTGEACLKTDRQFIGIEKDLAIFVDAKRHLFSLLDNGQLFTHTDPSAG